MGTIGRPIPNDRFDTYTEAETDIINAAQDLIINDKADIVDVDADLALKADLASPALTGVPTINGNNVSGITGFKNKIINGGFDVWQRGDSFTGTSVYTADRWFLNQGGETSAITKITSAANSLWEGATVASFGITSGSLANTGRSIQQRIENVNLFKNKEVTLSLVDNGAVGQDVYAVVRQVDDIGGTLWVDTVKKISTGDGTIKRSSATFTLPDITSKYDEVNSRFDVIIYPQYTDGSSIAISNVQLEEGSVATAFEQRPVGLELGLCQRYLIPMQVGTGISSFASPRSNNNELTILFPTPTEMRAHPTVISGSAIITVRGGGVVNESTATFGTAIRHASHVSIKITTVSNPTVTDCYGVYIQTAQDAFLDAEL